MIVKLFKKKMPCTSNHLWWMSFFDRAMTDLGGHIRGGRVNVIMEDQQPVC